MVVKIGSMFTGVAGLSIAVEHLFVEAELSWYAEIDKHASKVMAARVPEIPNLGDVSIIDWSAQEPIDVLEGGFPCQDISHAGHGAGIHEGTRSGLWFEMVKCIRILRPSYVFLENVAAITSNGLGTVLGDLSELGFSAEWGVLRASDIGAPHRRSRWFLAAANADPERAAERERVRRGMEGAAGPGEGIIWEREWLRGSFDEGRPDAPYAYVTRPPGQLDGVVVHDAGEVPVRPDDLQPAAVTSGQGLEGLVGQVREGDADPVVVATPAVRPAADTVSVGTQSGDDLGHAGVEDADLTGPQGRTPSDGDSVGRERAGDSRGWWEGSADSGPDASDTDCRGREVQRLEESVGQGPPGDESDGRDGPWGEYREAVERWEVIRGRAPSAVIFEKDAHRLNPEFTEWMMGWPIGWTEGASRAQRVKMAGNGVVPQQAHTAYLQLIERLENR